MNFAKKFLKNNPLNISHINKSKVLLPIQYKILASKYGQKKPIKIPHSYSNKYDKIKMQNTLDILFEIYKK